MADPQLKLVKVDGLGVVAFPHLTDESKILDVIRKHKSKTKNPEKFGYTSEQAEHAAQQTPAQPLSTAIPSWATEPLLPKLRDFAGKVDDATTPEVFKKVQQEQAKSLAEYDKSHPVQAGIAKGIRNTEDSMSTPLNIGLMVGAPESRLLSAFFAVQALNGSYKTAQEAAKAYKEGRNKDAAEYWTEAILGGAMGVAAGAHAFRGKGATAPQGTVLPPEPKEPNGVWFPRNQTSLGAGPDTVEGEVVPQGQPRLPAPADLEPVEVTASQRKTKPQPPALRSDNPGGRWLQENKDYSTSRGLNTWGGFNSLGKVTGIFQDHKPVMLPVDVLASLPGSRGEHLNPDENKIQEIAENYKQTGRLPQENGKDYAPFVTVDQNGKPWISEGNHRIMAAKRAGMKYLPVEVRYFNGGEQVPGALHPDAVTQYHNQAQNLGYTPQDYTPKPTPKVADLKQQAMQLQAPSQTEAQPVVNGVDFSGVIADVRRSVPAATGIELGGSFARGDMKPKSDIDIIVQFPAGTNQFEAAMALDDLFKKYRAGIGGRVVDFIAHVQGSQSFVGQHTHRLEQGLQTPKKLLWGQPYDDTQESKDYLKRIQDAEAQVGSLPAPQAPATPQKSVPSAANSPRPNNGIQMARTAEGKVKMGADAAALGKILGSSLYSGDSAKIITKELLQNALDALRGVQDGEKKVTVYLNKKYNLDLGEDETEIRVEDTGKGMTKDELETVFTDLGSSGKRDQADASGGFGLAKAAPMMMSNRIEVRTIVKENGKFYSHSFHATPEDLLGEGVHITTEELTGEHYTGTTVSSYLPKTADLYGPKSFIDQSRRSLESPGQIEVYTDNRKDYQAKYPPMEPTPRAVKVVPGAKLSLFASNHPDEQPTSKYGGLTIEVHNNGIYQFSIYGQTPEGIRGLPKRIAVNVQATVPEGDPNYPFLANRESLRGDKDKAIKELVQEEIVAKLASAHGDLLSQMYKQMPTLEGGNSHVYFFDSGGRLTPEELTEIQNDPAVGRIGDEVYMLTARATMMLDTASKEGKLPWSLENVGEKIKRVGLVFAPEIHGVYIPDPRSPDHAAGIFINPFGQDIEGSDPYEVASRVWHTIKHEIIHDIVKGHSETFTSAEAAISKALGRMEMLALTKLKDAYADPDDDSRLRPDLDRPIQIYQDSRRRDEVVPDIFGGENSRADLDKPAGKDAGRGSLRHGGERTVPGKLDLKSLREEAKKLKPREVPPSRAEDATPVDDITMSLKYKAADQTQPFYLKSEKILGEKMKGPMPAQDIQKMLLANGVKAEEMKSTGLDKFLESKGNAKVTPRELQEFIEQNDLQIEEVGKGGTTAPKPVKPEQLTIRQSEHQYHAVNPVGGKEESVGKGTVDSEQEAREYLARHMSRVNMERYQARSSASETKFSTWVLPGAEPDTYRELLVTMPKKKEPPPSGKAYTDYVEWTAEIAEQYGWNAAAWPDEIRAEQARRLDDYSTRQSQERQRASDTSPNFHSTHYDEPNIVGHTRFNDRTGPNGEKILHVEEIQSDWHQKGRSGGYKESIDDDKRDEMYRDLRETRRLLSNSRPEAINAVSRLQNLGFGRPGDALAQIAINDDWATRWNVPPEEAAHIQPWRDLVHQETAMSSEWDRILLKNRYAVPDAPFKKTWHELLLKRIIKYAADNGYDGVSWTPGEEQADRYDLSKHISELHYDTTPKRGNFLIAKDHSGRMVMEQYATPEELPDIIGKEAAQKLLSQQKDRDGIQFLGGVDLKVGGEGMKGFYDQMLPAAANKIGKQWGAKVGTIEIPTSEVKKQGNGIILKGKETKRTVPYLPITPEMRTSGPLPLFKLVYKSPGVSPERLADAYRNMGDIEREITSIMGGMSEPDLTDPRGVQDWIERNRQRIQRAKPWFDRLNQVKEHVADLERQGMGQIRDLPNGARVLYLNGEGLKLLRMGMTGTTMIDPSYELNGASMSPQQVAQVWSNLKVLKPNGVDELQKLLMAATNRSGIVTVSAIPKKGQSLHDAVATLREELNHGWQKAFGDSVGNHLPKDEFSALNSAIPAPLQDYLVHNGYAVDNGNEKNTRMRVLEASAKLLSEAPHTLGVSEDEAAMFLFQYFAAVERHHGSKAIDELRHITAKAREIKDDYFNATGRAGATGDSKGTGRLPRVQNGGLSGPQGTSPQAERGSATGSDGAGESGVTENQKHRNLPEWDGLGKIENFPGREPGGKLSKITVVPIKDLVPTESALSQEVVDSIYDSFVNGGDEDIPALVVEKSYRSGKYDVVDGHHRLAAAKRAGYKTAPVRVYTHPEDIENESSSKPTTGAGLADVRSLLDEAKRINSMHSTITATGPNSHKIRSNDGGSAWYDVETGELVH